MSDMKSKLDRIRHYREKNSELGNTAIETVQNKMVREKRQEKKPQNISELWDNFRKSDTQVIEIPQKRKGQKMLKK